MASYNSKGDVPEPSPYCYDEQPSPTDPAVVRAMPPSGTSQPPANTYQSAASDDGIRVGEWDAALCGCTTHAVPNCLMVTFCPCVTLGQISQRLGIISYAATVSTFAVIVLVQWVTSLDIAIRLFYIWQPTDRSTSYEWSTSHTLLILILVCADAAMFLFVWHLRAQIRERFQLPGSGLGVCLAALCCPCCSVAQLATHVKSYKPNNCDFAAPNKLPAYDSAPVIASHSAEPIYRNDSQPDPTVPSDHRSIDIHQQRYNTPSTAPSSASRPSANPRSIHSNRSTSSGPNSKGLWDDATIVAARIPFEGIQLQQCISRGGNGEVYRAVYRNEYVAVKMLLAATRKDMKHINAFLSEIKLAATLEHPNIVRFIGVAWESLSTLYSVAEFMDGGDLRSLLIEFKRQNHPHGFDATKLRIAMEVAHALTYMHSLSPVVLHRDLKSRNVLLTSRLEAKLTDFGASKIRLDRTLTAGVGTSLWMAPEVVMGERYDEKADVFSFGAVLSELDTHELPYEKARHNREDGQTLPDLAVMQLVLLGKLRMNFTSILAPELRSLVESCVKVDPKRRPTAGEVAYGLSKALRAMGQSRRS
jgi:Cys-rich protein (TIGR01571 family)